MKRGATRGSAPLRLYIKTVLRFQLLWCTQDARATQTSTTLKMQRVKDSSYFFIFINKVSKEYFPAPVKNKAKYIRK